MEGYPYNFLIVTHECTEEKCLKNSHILEFFGHLLQREGILNRYK